MKCGEAGTGRPERGPQGILLLRRINCIDQMILLEVQRWRGSTLTNFFLGLTYSGTGRAWFAVSVILSVLNHRGVHFVLNQADLMRSLFAPLLAWILSSALKRFISRKRPSSEIKGFEKVIAPPDCGSFPSSHAAAAFSFFFALAFIAHPLSILVGVWAVLVSFSRVYLGVHYASDVLGGLLLGSACAFTILWKFL